MTKMLRFVKCGMFFCAVGVSGSLWSSELKVYGSAYDYFSSTVKFDQYEQLKLESLDISPTEMEALFFDKHWISFDMCDERKIPDAKEESTKLIDFFKDGILKQLRFPGLQRRTANGATEFPY